MRAREDASAAELRRKEMSSPRRQQVVMQNPNSPDLPIVLDFKAEYADSLR